MTKSRGRHFFFLVAMFAVTSAEIGSQTWGTYELSKGIFFGACIVVAFWVLSMLAGGISRD
jgi:hypothetical protein